MRTDHDVKSAVQTLTSAAHHVDLTLDAPERRISRELRVLGDIIVKKVLIFHKA
jgi:hypothetical protein